MYNLYKEYLEYFDWLDNQILLRSRDRKLEKANKKNENLINEIKEMIDNNKLYDLRVNISVSGENINVLKKILSVKKIIEKNWFEYGENAI